MIATPIRHSKSPKMHNEAFAKLGLDYAYLAFEVGNEELEDAVKGLSLIHIYAKITTISQWFVSGLSKVKIISCCLYGFVS